MEKSKITHTIVSERFSRLFASVIVVIGLIVIIGWFGGLMFLTRFSVNEVPMAPSTAYVFIFMAAGLWFYLCPQTIAINRNAAIASAVIAICLSCLLVITNTVKYYANWEHVFIKIPETQLSMQLGHMSLVTALLFIISGFALLFLRSNRKIVKAFSIILTLIIFLTSFVLMLGYAFGTPFFYFDNFIPPAVLTVLSFLLVSSGLIAASDKNTFFVKSIWATTTSAKLLRIFLPATVAITVIESLIVIRILPLLNIHPAIGVSSVSLFVVAVVIVVISIISKSMGKTLDSALENLRESEAKFRIVFENSPIGKSMTGVDGSLQVNESFCKIVGYTKEELRAKTWIDISHPEEIKQTTEIIQSLLDGNISQAQFEKRYIHKNGTIVFTDVSTYLQRDTNNDPQFFITSVFDITERKLAEERLKISEQRSMAYLENSPACTKIVDLDFNLQFMSKAGIDGLHIDNIDEYYGKPYPFTFYPDSFKVPMTRNLKKAKESGEIITQEAPVVDVDGNELWFHSTIVPVKDNNGLLEYIMVVSIDTTERKQAEQALKESEEQLRIITDNLPVLISQIDSNLKYIFANKYYNDVGVLQDSIIGENVVDVIGKETFDRAYSNMQKALSGELVSFENKYLNKKNNKLLFMESHYIPYVVNDQVESFFVLAIDITERKLAENKVTDAFEKLSKAEVIAKVGSWSWSPNTNIVEWSDNMCRLYGIEPSEFDPTLDYAIRCTHPDDLDYVNKLTKDLLTEKIPQPSSEYRIITPDNKIVWIESTAQILSDRKGNIKEFVGTVQDITERKQIEEEIKKNQLLLQQAEEISNQGAWEWDIIQDEWSFSENWLRIHGCRLSGITREELMTIAYPEDAPGVEKAFQDALKEGRSYNVEHRIVRQDDSEVRYVRAKGNLILNNSGQQVKMYGVAQDITDSKLAEEALRESEGKLTALFTSLTEMVVIHELVLNDAGDAIDYRIIDCNKVFTEFTGILKEDAIGKLASEVYQTTPPPYLEKYAKVGLGGDPHEFTTYSPPLGKHFMISVVSPQAGKFATITTDISDMMQAQEMIMAKNKEMENYLYVASHDLRTPLVNIQGFSQRLKKQADSIKNLFADKNIDPEIRYQLGNITGEDIPKTLNFILSSIEKMDALINGLLQVSRTGRVEMNIQEIDMNELFVKIFQSLDFQIKEAQCEIHIKPLPGCYGDAVLLDQLFANIISNALKYSDSKRDLEITVDAKKIHNRVIYTIRDTGKGIAQKHLEKIWDIFYRIDPRSSKTGEGIGLSLVRRIAEKNQGKVWVESEENKGSVFYIELHNRSFT